MGKETIKQMVERNAHIPTAEIEQDIRDEVVKKDEK